MENFKWILVDEKTYREINIGDTVTIRGEEKEWVVSSFDPPHKPSASGRVYIKDADGNSPIGGCYFAHVFGLKYVKHVVTQVEKDDGTPLTELDEYFGI
jgi:hypothetical protein